MAKFTGNSTTKLFCYAYACPSILAGSWGGTGGGCKRSEQSHAVEGYVRIALFINKSLFVYILFWACADRVRIGRNMGTTRNTTPVVGRKAERNSSVPVSEQQPYVVMESTIHECLARRGFATTCNFPAIIAPIRRFRRSYTSNLLFAFFFIITYNVL